MIDPRKLYCCPYCGGRDGIYREGRASGPFQHNYGFFVRVGVAANETMHDGLSYRENKLARCLECHRVIGGWEND